jgi:hypothetical protein
VLQIAIRPFEIGLILGDLSLICCSLGIQIVSPLLDLANRKGVLFKLVFETRTPFLSRFDRSLQSSNIGIGDL